MPRTLIRCKPLKDVFAWSDDAEKEMQVQFARLSVLFEDLMLEHAGARAEDIGIFDGSGRLQRQFYFVRRAINTIAEMAQAIHVLNMNRAFKQHKRSIDRWQRDRWDEAAKFFARNNEFLNTWRDDMGGHFLDRTAKHALEKMDATVVGTMEIYQVPSSDRMHNVRFKYAYDIVAGGISRRMTDGDEFAGFAERSFEFVYEAWGHAAQAVHTVVQTHLWQRFG